MGNGGTHSREGFVLTPMVDVRNRPSQSNQQKDSSTLQYINAQAAQNQKVQRGRASVRTPHWQKVLLSETQGGDPFECNHIRQYTSEFHLPKLLPVKEHNAAPGEDAGWARGVLYKIPNYAWGFGA
jgi:hypothetical protein